MHANCSFCMMAKWTEKLIEHEKIHTSFYGIFALLFAVFACSISSAKNDNDNVRSPNSFFHRVVDVTANLLRIDPNIVSFALLKIVLCKIEIES